MERVEVLVVGAGVVGCALARALAPRRSVLVLERQAAPGLVTSSHNSGVIHSGIHLPPGFLKARLAVRGKALIEAYCRESGVPCSRVGMHVLVARRDLPGLWPETGRLLSMLRRAAAQRITARFAGRAAVRRREPCVECLFGIHIPEVAIVDAPALVGALHRDAARAGARFEWRSPVAAIAPDGDRWRVQAGDAEHSAGWVINAAGLEADRVAALAGFRYRQGFYRGEYYEVDREASGLRLNGLVYPVHRPGQPGLGIHLTSTVSGRLLIGPNATRLAAADPDSAPRTPPEPFHAAAARFLPGLRLEHLRWADAGVRPKLGEEPGERDFVVAFEPGRRFVNLIGIESPGLTASLALAEHVREGMLQRGLDA